MARKAVSARKKAKALATAAGRKKAASGKAKRTLKLALPAWEIGWAGKGVGSKIGGLAAVVEELPAELQAAAQRQGIDLEIEVLSPCFAHYERGGRGLKPTGQTVTARLDGHEFPFEVYRAPSPDRASKLIYFWDEGQLHWTHARAIYPEDPALGLRLYASLSQAMAAYIAAGDFDTIHAHDYHVGLIPFYLPEEVLRRVPFHFTVHNATYQGTCWVGGAGYQTLRSIGLPEHTFHDYFDYFGHLNLMKGVVIRTHQLGGRVTTVSGDLDGSWGYAAELRRNQSELLAQAQSQKGWDPVQSVYVPNGHLDVFEKIPVAGITNGLADKNRPEKMRELYGVSVRAMQRHSDQEFFRHPEVREEMSRRNHRFDAGRLDVKERLKRLLHLEAFGSEPVWDPILLTAVGRLVEQKNLGLVLDVAERVFAHDAGAKFVIMASPQGSEGVEVQRGFQALAGRYPDRFYYSSAFNHPLSRLILAGGDFCLIPSRFEPCGLVDYEASLLGNVVIARHTGGLPKVSHCAYLYEWLDVADHRGEAQAFFAKIREALDNYRYRPEHHLKTVARAMGVDASWAPAADRYLQLYRYGQLMKRWQEARRELTAKFVESLGEDRELFREFLAPGAAPYADPSNWALKLALETAPPPRP